MRISFNFFIEESVNVQSNQSLGYCLANIPKLNTKEKPCKKLQGFELKILKILDYYASLTFTAFNPFLPS